MENRSFEENMARLKEIIRIIQSGELNMDDSIEIFKEGIELSKFLEDKLNVIEQKAVKIFDNDDVKDFE